MNQGSVLSPLFFILVLEALSRKFRTGVPRELLYADDLVVMADSLEECIAKLKACKEGMEHKGLRVNMKKTKLMVSGPGLDLLCESGAFPCAVCRSGVRVNFIECSKCKNWVHKKCSGVRGRLVEDPAYVCPRCSDQAQPIDNRPVTHVDVDGTLLDVEPNFCYLGDMLCAGGGCKLLWYCLGNFKRLLPILTSNHVSLRTRWKVFNACVRSALLHGSETWSVLRQTYTGFAGMTDQWISGVRARGHTLCNVRGAGVDSSCPY